MFTISFIVVCKSGYDKVGNLCYRRIWHLINGFGAKNKCEQEGDILATIPNEQVNNF